MPTAEELKARFENRLRPGPTDDRLNASLGLLASPAEPEPAPDPLNPAEADGTAAEPQPAPAKPIGREAKAKPRRQAVRLVTATDPKGEAGGAQAAQGRGSGGVGLDGMAELFPPPPLLAAAGPEPVKVGFPVPVDLIRDVTRLKVDLSRRLGRRLSNHEIGAAATRLLPGDPGEVAELVRGHAERLGLTEQGTPRRRLVADVHQGAATGLEDLVLAVDETEGVRVTKSQLWALAHVLLLERAGR